MRLVIIEPAEREHGGRALHDKPHAKARQTKHHPKINETINQKSIKNLSKIEQKSAKNGPPEGLGEPLGGVPETSWAVLRRV